jgi:single-strand DNA-binding protein
MRYTPSGTPVTNFSVATDTKISKVRNGEDVPCPEGWEESYNGKSWSLTTWWRCTAWRGLAEVVNQYAKKGTQVFIKGEIKGEATNGTQYPRIWTGNDNVPRASFEVTVRVFKLLGSGGNGGAPAPRDQDEPQGYVEENDIPF